MSNVIYAFTARHSSFLVARSGFKLGFTAPLWNHRADNNIMENFSMFFLNLFTLIEARRRRKTSHLLAPFSGFHLPSWTLSKQVCGNAHIKTGCLHRLNQNTSPNVLEKRKKWFVWLNEMFASSINNLMRLLFADKSRHVFCANYANRCQRWESIRCASKK